MGEVRQVGGIAAGMESRIAADRERGGIVVERLDGGKHVELTWAGGERQCVFGFERNSSLLSGPLVGIRMRSGCCVMGLSRGLASIFSF